ncbi:hypothetical protein GF327_06570 [Candidatus Woesearchaeota archaeon]|nr:hypothetical protein [Candidatus Woesearchaeota archaeon]
MVNNIVKIFEKRKHNLINLLETSRETMDPGKQHQIYGAIQEIDFMIQTLNIHTGKQHQESLIKRKNNKINFK